MVPNFSFFFFFLFHFYPFLLIFLSPSPLCLRRKWCWQALLQAIENTKSHWSSLLDMQCSLVVSTLLLPHGFNSSFTLWWFASCCHFPNLFVLLLCVDFWVCTDLKKNEQINNVREDKGRREGTWNVTTENHPELWCTLV